MSTCCSSSQSQRRLTPYACLERGLRTRRRPALSVRGARQTGTGERWAEFSATLDASGHLSDLRFACASCTTLIACCQALVELNRGCPGHAPCVVRQAALLSRLPGLPPSQFDRAALAIAAFAALLSAVVANDAAVAVSSC